jgi:hypothetical protein
MTTSQKRMVKKLVAALRRGNYKQGRLQLRTSNGYCCLGVACLVAGKKFVGDECLGQNYRLPPVVQSKFGFVGNRGSFGGGSLTQLNDDGTTFQEIADLIESEPMGMFV